MKNAVPMHVSRRGASRPREGLGQLVPNPGPVLLYRSQTNTGPCCGLSFLPAFPSAGSTFGPLASN
jgi:hypothetical protein